jgi:Cyclic nucleotide-binding domain
MEKIALAIRQMIAISEQEMKVFLSQCTVKNFKRKAFLSLADRVSHEVFFINKGLTRNILIDNEGNEHTTHFTIENQFIADYASFLQHIPSIYAIQALEEVEVVVMPRKAIEWGYQNLAQGDKLGRIIAEYYFIYNDTRIKNIYTVPPKDRYNAIESVFPDIHNRVPQHMIASYLGITPIHLSRLKKADRAKV